MIKAKSFRKWSVAGKTITDDQQSVLKLTKKMRGRIKMAYIKDLRAKVGHQPLIMTSASGALVNEKQQVLLQERADTGDWGFPGGYIDRKSVV